MQFTSITGSAVFAFGGLYLNKTFNDLWIYNLKSNSWYKIEN